MADYYTQFAMSLDDVSSEEAQWIREMIAEDEDGFPKFMQDWEDRDEMLGFLAFDLTFDDDRTVKITDLDGYGNEGQLARFLQMYLKRWRPDTYLGLSFAYTCSKPRNDAFGGGAAFITADYIEWMSLQAFLHGQALQFLRRLRRSN